MSIAAPNHLQTLPAWAQELSEKYYSGATAMFVLHGNVRDLVAWRKAAGVEFLPLQRFLQDALFGPSDFVIFYDRGGGLSFGKPDMKADFERALSGYDSFHGTNFTHGLPRNPDGVLNILDNYLRLRIGDGKKIALIIDFAETVAPAGDSSGMPAEDRNALVILKRCAQNAAFLRADVTFCLIAENMVELNLGLVQNPGVASIEIPLPSEEERREFLESQLAAKPLPPGSDVTAATLATLTAGLRRVHLRSLIANAAENQRPLTMKFLVQRKKELIEAESGGLLEFVQSRFDLSLVAGHESAKKKLYDGARAIRAGKIDVLPMGYVICGPVGTGKTFLTTVSPAKLASPRSP